MRGPVKSITLERRRPETLCEGIVLRHALLTLRPQEQTDEAFLDILLKDECGDAFERLDPPRDLLTELIRSQRRGEAARIAKRYRQSEQLIIARGAAPIGRLTLAHEVTEFGSCLRIADMAILRYHQSRGYGRSILCDLVDSARRMGFHRVNVTVFAAHDVFIQLLKAVGFRAVGTLDPTSQQALMFPLP